MTNFKVHASLLVATVMLLGSGADHVGQAQTKDELKLVGFGTRLGATREKLLKEGGGTEASEAAVAAGLKWLAKQQTPDGSWTLDGKVKDKMAGTALALLPLLGSGQTHKHTGKTQLYSKEIERGLKFLLDNQGSDGSLGSNAFVHSLATMALCEAYGMTADPDLKTPAQRAITYLVDRQKPGGNWEGYPPEAGSAATFGTWPIQALKAGQLSGLTVPNETYAKVNKYLDSASDEMGLPKEGTSRPAYMLSRIYVSGWGPRNPALSKSADILVKRSPNAKMKDIDFYFLATPAIHCFGDERWKAWNSEMRELLIATQDKGKDDPKHTGSWSPDGDPLAPYGGRLMQTSLSVLTLEVYYRYNLFGRILSKDLLDAIK